MPFEKGKIPKGAKPFKKNDDRINTDGRPVGSKNRATLVREIIQATTKQKNELTGKKESIEYQYAMVARLVKKVLDDGDVQAFRELMDSAYGKNADVTEIDLTHREEVDYTQLSDQALDEIISADKRKEGTS